MIQGIAYMVTGIGLLSLMDALVKWLGEGGVHPMQLIAMRSWIIVCLFLLFYASRKQGATLKPNNALAVHGRSALGFFAPLLFFLSLQYLPIANVTVTFFSSTFMITVLSWPILKERVGWHRIMAIVVGFIGVLIAVETRGDVMDWRGYVLCLLGSLAYSVLFITGRLLSRSESTVALVFSFNLVLGLIATLLLPWFWQAVDRTQLLYILLFSLLALFGHLCITKAFAHSPVGVLAPYEYTALFWAVITGYLIWGDVPGLRVWIGATLIIGAGLYVIYRESLNKRQTTLISDHK